MTRAADATVRLPTLPVLGWATFAGARQSNLRCILDRPDIVFTSSGRAAIALALRDLGIGHGDEVLVPTYHCPTMIAPVVAVGAQPVFFPIDAAGAPRIDLIAKMDLRNVRAIIAAHYFGLPQPMTAIRRLCDDHGIALIEDCAHAMFGEIENRPVGGTGHYAIASLTKFLPTTDGGCLVGGERRSALPHVPRKSIVDDIRRVANAIEIGARYRRLPGLNGLLMAGFMLADTMRIALRARVHDRSGREKPLPKNPLAEFAAESTLWRAASTWSRFIARTAHRDRIITLRRRNYGHLAELLADLPGAHVLWPRLPELAAPYVLPLWVDAPERSYQAIRRAGVPVFRWDDVWPDAPVIPGDHGADWAVHILQLGCHQDLELDDLRVMADTLRQILSSVQR